MKNKQPLVVGVGLCALDYLIMVNRYPAAGQKVDAAGSDIQCGGPVPTALCTLAKLGMRTTFIGKCGDDYDGRQIMGKLREFGVDTSAMVIDQKARSPRAFIWIEKDDGERTVVLDHTGIDDLTADEIDYDLIKQCRYLLIDGRETEASLKAAAIAKEHGAEVIFDAGSNRRRLGDILNLTDHLIASENFAGTVFPGSPASNAAQKLFESGKHKAVVITLGEKGAIACSADGVYWQPAFSVSAVDTTGAGDVFHGAYIFALSRDFDLPGRLEFASAAAALKCRRFGGGKGCPSLEEIRRFIEHARGLDMVI